MTYPHLINTLSGYSIFSYLALHSHRIVDISVGGGITKYKPTLLDFKYTYL